MGDPVQRDAVEKWNEQERIIRLHVQEAVKYWLGVVELTGNNDHPKIAKAMRLCGLRGDKGYPWCAASHSDIYDRAGVVTVISARVVDWFKSNVIWERSWGTPIPKSLLRPSMSVGYYYEHLGRYGHIGLSFIFTDNFAYVFEGNTSSKNTFNPENFNGENSVIEGVNRDGDGFYPKVRPLYQIDVISDKCMPNIKAFENRYGEYLNSVL